MEIKDFIKNLSEEEHSLYEISKVISIDKYRNTLMYENNCFPRFEFICDNLDDLYKFMYDIDECETLNTKLSENPEKTIFKLRVIIETRNNRSFELYIPTEGFTNGLDIKKIHFKDYTYNPFDDRDTLIQDVVMIYESLLTLLREFNKNNGTKIYIIRNWEYE